VSKAVDEAVKAIEAEITNMARDLERREYLEVLEEIASIVDSRIDAVKEELEEEEG
jgi:hypothetical protein